jgi:hypothetical protein
MTNICKYDKKKKKRRKKKKKKKSVIHVIQGVRE